MKRFLILSLILMGLLNCGGNEASDDGSADLKALLQGKHFTVSNPEAINQGMDDCEMAGSLDIQSNQNVDMDFGSRQFSCEQDGDEVAYGNWDAVDGNTVVITVDGIQIYFDVAVHGNVLVIRPSERPCREVHPAAQGSPVSGGAADWEPWYEPTPPERTAPVDTNDAWDDGWSNNDGWDN